MKRIIAFISAIVLCSMSFISCQKEGETAFYRYGNIMKFSHDTNMDAIYDALGDKIDMFEEMTEDEAIAEWNRFVSEVEANKSTLYFVNDSEFCTITMYKNAWVGDDLKESEFRTKTWNRNSL